jgi:outer membrane scaffolding protein for murein synthesis (MipA/OmpV family)
MRSTFAALAAALAATAAHGQTAEPLWEIGGVALAVSQQAYPGADQQIQRGLALPYLLYRGETLRVDRGGAGLRAVKRPAFEVDIGVAGAFGARSKDIDARRGMPDLGTLVEFGPRLTWNLDGDTPNPAGGRWRVELPLRGVFDLNDSLAHRGLSFEPELQYARRSAGGWSYSASAGLMFADRRLARTFYAVDAADATAARPTYEARAGLLATRLGLTVSRLVTADWRVFGFAHLDSVAGAVNRASPLVRRNTGGSVGVGVAWTWLRSERAAAD